SDLTCFGQWPLGCRAPLLPRGRIDRAEMDRRLALPAVVHVLEEAIEEAQQLRLHREVADLAMSPCPHPQLARIVQVVERENGLEAAFVEPVAPEEEADLGALDLLDVCRDARLLPERHAEQRRNVVTIRHAARQLRHRGTGGMRRDRLLGELSVAVFIDRQHALTEILRWVFGSGVELRGDASAAHESILVEIRA